ncbi:hypothetical protein TRIP_E300129 [uncultured Spirochaetota bacterium]|uniref:Uncharacterized protein n=1 Tax=uncultured Spirochaetota bacterium TaxID=460511 RepID=A0A652ZXV4_9SPIR|nr:hypothetical protein TRIP_E300129 [uncultured Spirochaetota bacterium]
MFSPERCRATSSGFKTVMRSIYLDSRVRDLRRQASAAPGFIERNPERDGSYGKIGITASDEVARSLWVGLERTAGDKGLRRPDP